MPVLTLHPDYGYVILVATGMALHCVGQGFPVGKLRKEFKLDYPDMGSGRYAAKLTDQQWLQFNNAQRAHYNYVEGFGPAVALLLLGGLFFPKENAAIGAVYIVGRQLYASGYRAKGSSGRMLGVAMLDLALLSMAGTSVWGAIKQLGYY
ncbi:Microsomal glutathione S-transferase 3 [Sorochytrium milnesiophthora]